MRNEPDKVMEPMPMSVTDRAIARSVPAKIMAHLRRQAKHMNLKKHLIIYALGIVFPFACIIIWVSFYLSRSEAETWASYAGGLQAKEWFAEGKYRLLEISEDDMHFTGRHEGEFEIWAWKSYQKPKWLFLVPDASHRFVQAFNERMRKCYEKKKTVPWKPTKNNLINFDTETTELRHRVHRGPNDFSDLFEFLMFY
jgi:hypothetical protein